MTEPTPKDLATAAARLALRGYALTENPSGWRITGHGRDVHLAIWAKVALFTRLTNTSGEAGNHDAHRIT
jgi:hypothetical protein